MNSATVGKSSRIEILLDMRPSGKTNPDTRYRRQPCGLMDEVTVPQLQIPIAVGSALLIAFATPIGQSASQVLETSHVDGELIVCFRAEHAPSALTLTEQGLSFGIVSVDSLLLSSGLSGARSFAEGYDPATVPLARTFLVRCSPDTDEDALCQSLRELPEVERATPNLLMRREYGGIRTETPSTSTTRFGAQWYLHDPENDDADIDAPEAWAITRGSSDVVVAIHDSGIMVDASESGCYELHGDLEYYWTSENVGSPTKCFDINDIDNTDSAADPDTIRDNVIGYNFAPHWPGETDQAKIRFWHSVPSDWVLTGTAESPTSMNCRLTNEHGTRVASIAAGLWTSASSEEGGDIVGVANQCLVYVVRAGGANDLTKLSDEIDALKHAAEYAQVINMSWGFEDEPDSTFKSAIDFAAETKNCVLVSITHNQGRDDLVRWPAAYPNVLAVGAIKKNLDLCSYSNYNENEAQVDLVAGVENGIPADTHTICTTAGGGSCPCAQEELYTSSTGTGTSFAAPQVAGVAALVRSRFPGLPQDKVRARLKRAAEYYWAPEDSFKFGRGKVNAYRSITEWGKITDTRTWKQYTAGDSTIESRDGIYYIAGDLVIEPGAVLTIQADAVRVAAVDPDIPNLGSDASRVEIIVKGTLNVIGTLGNPVTFESFTDSTSTGSDWVGIKFEAGSKGILKHVVIENATQDVLVSRPAVTVTNWDEKKTLYLDSDFTIASDDTVAADEDLYVLGASMGTVTAGSEVDLVVDGSLIVQGAGNYKPEFRSSSGVARSWGTLTLTSTSSGHTIHDAIIRDAQLPIRTYVPVTIDSCLIRGAVDGIQSNANSVVKNTTMHDFTGSAIVWKSGNLDLKNLDIYDAAYGLYQSTSTSTGTLACRALSLRDIDYRGIDVPSASSGVTIKQTTVRDATDAVFLAYQTSAVVDSCEFRANDIGVLMLLSSGTSLKHCDVDSNATAGIYLVAYTHTTMELDTIAHSPIGVYSYASNPSLQTSRLLSNSVGLKCESNASPTVRTTRIQFGTTGILALDGSAPDLGTAPDDTCGSIDAGDNSISNNSSYHVANFDAGETVYAQCNWWNGTPSPSKFYGNVVYTPYVSSDPNPASMERPGPGDQPPAPRIPANYALHPNRPNPFNPVTVIGYDVPAPGGRVNLVVYDVNGRLVRVLVASHRSPGTYAETWEGRNEQGSSVASGVYFVRMTAGSFSHTRKVVLLK